jgi:serine protease Do
MQKCRSRLSTKTVRILLPFLMAAFTVAILAIPSSLRAAEKPRGTPPDLTIAVVQVAKRNIPAVAHIEVSGTQEYAQPALPFENDPFFRYFFGAPKGPRKFKRELKGLGTGMLMDPQGHILTNYHVVGKADKIDVLLADGTKYRARLIGSDPKTDLAVLRISANGRLPHVTFGDSDKIEVGEWVVAIGHPRGLDQTVTQGIISAKHRRGITDPSSYQDFLQTDAAINPGNSGGPLLNLQGEVIGVNAVILSESGGYEGIGFAIPSNIALHIAKTLITQGKVERGWIGVSSQDVSPERAKTLGLEAPRGALIGDVVKGGPADKGGLRKGDVVLAVQGKDVANAGALRNEIAHLPTSRDIKVTVLRNGRKQDLTIRIGTFKDAAKALSGSVKQRLGAEVRAITPKEAKRYNLSGGQGVAIGWMDPKGPLARAGFEEGDMILELNGQAIGNLESFVEIVSSLPPNQQITLLALDHRSGNTGYLQMKTR